ncbi:MAG: hypothetical protein IPH45_21105 [Bacteroidales bacterium]|nr:hypothetical protein [Bacteroidales bacterium]
MAKKIIRPVASGITKVESNQTPKSRQKVKPVRAIDTVKAKVTKLILPGRIKKSGIWISQ